MKNRNTVVKRSTIHGNGLFACRRFAAKDHVEDVIGDIVLRESNSKYAIRLKWRRSLIIANKAKYINQSSQPNVCININKGVIALCDINDGDELLMAYELTVF